MKEIDEKLANEINGYANDIIISFQEQKIEPGLCFAACGMAFVKMAKGFDLDQEDMMDICREIMKRFFDDKSWEKNEGTQP